MSPFQATVDHLDAHTNVIIVAHFGRDYPTNWNSNQPYYDLLCVFDHMFLNSQTEQNTQTATTKTNEIRKRSIT
jgi:hypothetical protein